MSKPTHLRLAWLHAGLAAHLLAACSDELPATPVPLDAGSPSSANDASSIDAGPFDFGASDSTQLGLRVLGNGQPLAGVHASLRVVDDSAEGVPEVVWEGVTSPDGQLDAALRLRPDTRMFDLTLVAPGWTGPYSEAELRSQHGITAPSAWLRLERRQLDGLVVDMTSEVTP